jgi:hypothetical protein
MACIVKLGSRKVAGLKVAFAPPNTLEHTTPETAVLENELDVLVVEV